MKNLALLVTLVIVLSVLLFPCVSCRQRTGATSEAASAQRFATLLRERSPETWNKRPQKEKTQHKLEAMNRELDLLTRQFIETNDIGAFQSIVEIESHIAASIGVFGIMEIANGNYMIKPDSKTRREHGLSAIAAYTAHPSPHVRGAALYSLGLMRRHEHKALVAACVDDEADSHLFFPPFVESNHGLTTSVGAAARRALKLMLGEREAKEYLRSQEKGSRTESTVTRE